MFSCDSFLWFIAQVRQQLHQALILLIVLCSFAYPVKGRGTLEKLWMGRLCPEVKPWPFCIPLTEKLPLSHTLHHPFLINNIMEEHEALSEEMLTKELLSFLVPVYVIPKWQISLPFHIAQLVKSPQFIYLKPAKGALFEWRPPCIGHYAEYPSSRFTFQSCCDYKY